MSNNYSEGVFGTKNSKTISEKSSSKQQDQYDPRLKGIEDKLANIEKEFTNRIIQLLTIFISFFTFVSIEFKILQNIPNLYILIGLSLFLLGGLLSFVIIINVLLTSSFSRITAIVGVFCVLLITFGVIFSCNGIGNNYVLKNDLSQYYKIKEIDDKFQEKLDKSDKQLQNCLKNEYYINCNK